jgi:hypothetical protein
MRVYTHGSSKRWTSSSGCTHNPRADFSSLEETCSEHSSPQADIIMAKAYWEMGSHISSKRHVVFAGGRRKMELYNLIEVRHPQQTCMGYNSDAIILGIRDIEKGKSLRHYACSMNWVQKDSIHIDVSNE